jgi:hypothetical protein
MLETLFKKANITDFFIIIISSLAIVGFWRGMWNLIDRFVFPHNFVLSQLVTIFSGIIILFILSRIK